MKYDFEVGKGISLAGLDPKLVEKAQKGAKFGAEDMARYNQLAGIKPGGKKKSRKAGEIFQSASTPKQTSKGGRGTVGTNSPSQRVQQDNDITTSIRGDGNKVTNMQDNSITQTNIDRRDQSRYYGGSSRIFNYQGGKGLSRLYDTPTSMATMGGFYDVDDSPSSIAKFNDLYTDLNNQNQRGNDEYYRKTGTFDYGSNKSQAFDHGKMMDFLNQSGQRSYDQADLETSMLYGDIYSGFNGGFKFKKDKAMPPVFGQREEKDDD